MPDDGRKSRREGGGGVGVGCGGAASGFRKRIYYTHQLEVHITESSEYEPLPPMTKKRPVVKAPIRNCDKNAPSFVLKLFCVCVFPS